MPVQWNVYLKPWGKSRMALVLRGPVTDDLSASRLIVKYGSAVDAVAVAVQEGRRLLLTDEPEVAAAWRRSQAARGA